MWVSLALPWVILTPVGFYGRVSSLALSWMLWAGLVSLAGGIAPWQPAVVVSAMAGGGTAAYLALWQARRLLGLCGFSRVVSFDCLPGPGLLIALAAGAFALRQGWRILRPAPGRL